MVFQVEGLDARFGSLGFVEMLVDGGGLGLTEPNEVDDVGEDLDQSVMRGSEEIGEGEIMDAALDRKLAHHPALRSAGCTSTSSFLNEK